MSTCEVTSVTGATCPKCKSSAIVVLETSCTGARCKCKSCGYTSGETISYDLAAKLWRPVIY